MAIEVYKILHQESPSYLHDLIKIKRKKIILAASIAEARVAIPWVY
jgi:hypothetical protein